MNNNVLLSSLSLYIIIMLEGNLKTNQQPLCLSVNQNPGGNFVGDNDMLPPAPPPPPPPFKKKKVYYYSGLIFFF